jgi:dTDP-4-amino-4,6-dideoxygalactose transaminase
MTIPFIDLKLQHDHLLPELWREYQHIFETSNFILGEEVEKFENALAEWLGVEIAVGVNSGSDALVMALRALEVGPGDEVILPTYTFVATADAIVRVGAKPVFVDIDERTYNIDPSKVAAAITPQTKAVIAVHLYGQAADIDAIRSAIGDRKIYVIEDCAQALGTRWRGKLVGTLGDAGCFSFYPTKNLGAAGDAGAIVSPHEQVFERCLLMRDHGRSITDPEMVFEMIGYNSRLSPLQAAFLRLKLAELEEALIDRIENARLYDQRFNESEVVTPEFHDDGRHTYNLYTIQVRDRDRLRNYLHEKKIGSAVYYARPLHLQPCFADLGYHEGSFPVAEDVAQKVISLPIFPGLKKREIESVAETVLEFLRNNAPISTGRRA